MTFNRPRNTTPAWTAFPHPTTIPDHTLAATKVRVVLLSFLISPVAFFVLYLSTAAISLSSAQGIPLSSYNGVAGILLGGLLLVIATLLGTVSPLASYITTGWAAIIAIGMLLTWRSTGAGSVVFGGSSLSATLNGTLMWSYLPAIIFFTCLGSSISLTLVHRWRRRNLAIGLPWKMRGNLGRSGTVSILASSAFAIGLWIVLLNQAPTDLALLATLGPHGLSVFHTNLIAVLITCTIATLFALSSSYSTLGIALSATVLMVFPGQILVPLWSTITGQVATPSSPANTALALASPLITTIGVVLLAVTAPVHFTRQVQSEHRTTDSLKQSERFTQKSEQSK